MQFKTLVLICATLVATPAIAREVPRQASIDHAANGGIRDWYAADSTGLFLRDRTNRWYYAHFRHACPGVLRDTQILFDTGGSHRFDRLSTVRTRTEGCAVDSVVRSQAPAAKGGRVNERRR